jgi:DegV family protein with EDD domain
MILNSSFRKRKMRPIKIVTDSTADLSAEIIKQYDIAVIPLYVSFGLQSYRDGLDIQTADLFREVKKTGKLPKTSAPTVEDFAAEFNTYIEKDMDVLYISISSKLSVSYQNACSAVARFPAGRIQAIDSFNVSTGIGILVTIAVDCLKRGLNLVETVSVVRATIPKVRTEFIIDTVEYLHKGGRCSGLQMLLSSLLEIHPIIKVADGAMHLDAKIRGNRQVVLRRLVKDALDNLSSIDRERIFITHSESADEAVWIRDQLAEKNAAKELTITSAGCVISSHCGPRTVGIIYLEK